MTKVNPAPNEMLAAFRAWTTLTQTEFADACGVSRSTVARWEAAVPVPAPDWLRDAVALDRWPKAPRSKAERSGHETGEAIRMALYASERARKIEAKRRPPHPRYVLLAALTAPVLLIVTIVNQRLLTEAQVEKVFKDHS